MSPADRPALWIAAGVYGLLVVAVGTVASLRTRTLRDFWVAGGSLGLATTALATMAASFSGFLFVGGPGLTQRLGLGSFFLVLPAGFTAALLGWVVARPLGTAARSGALSIPEAIGQRFGGPAQGLAAVAVAAGSVAYLAAQLLAVGVLLRPFLGPGETAVRLAVAAGAAVVVFYAVSGGMKAGIWTDVLQGGVMMAAGVFVFARALSVGGGLSGLARAVAASPHAPAGFLDPLGTAPVVTLASFVFLFGVGVLGQPHLVHKFLMMRDARQLRWFPAVLGGAQGLVILAWVGIGLAVPALVGRGEIPPLADPDLATATFLLEVGPDVLAGIVLAGVLAAVMSTADALVNVAAAALVRDLPRALGRPLGGELRAGRIATLALGILAAALALGWGDLVALLGTFAFGIFAASLTPVLALGLRGPAPKPRTAAVSIGAGLLLALGSELLARSPWSPFVPGLLPGAFALAASMGLYLVLAAADRRARSAS